MPRPKLFAAAAGIMTDNLVGGLQNGIGRAIILFEPYDFDLGKMALEIEEVCDLRAAPAVDTLIVIAYNAEVAMPCGEGMNQLELRGVGVLVLVHHHEAVALAAFFQRLGVIPKQAKGKENQGIEIDRIGGPQCRLIAVLEVSGEGDARGIEAQVVVRRSVAESTQGGENVAGLDLVGATQP